MYQFIYAVNVTNVRSYIRLHVYIYIYVYIYISIYICPPSTRARMNLGSCVLRTYRVSKFEEVDVGPKSPPRRRAMPEQAPPKSSSL